MNVFKQQASETNSPYMIMLVGLPASGKSTFAKKILIQDSKNICKPVIHSSDDLRKELFGSEESQCDNNKLFAELHKRVKADLINGNDVVYDATNISKKLRRQFLSELKNIPCNPVCVCMMTPYDICLKNNENRERKVPENIIKNMLNNWQPPHYSEGFTEIRYNFLGYTDDFSINKFLKIADNFEQENSHHSLSLGSHCRKAALYIQERRPVDKPLIFAALLHDIGKLYTKTRMNTKGIEDGDCHYYGHHSRGAYESLFYLYYDTELTHNEMVDVANLIYYHMHPYMQWKQSERVLNRDKVLLGEKMFKDVMLLHEADLYAH